jgi:membrane protease YdiL (CAAX protease family)
MKIHAGRLFPPENAPLPIVMPPISGWIFVVSVLDLIYLQSVLYALVVLVGIAGPLVGSRRTVGAQYGFDRVKPFKALTLGLVAFGAVELLEWPLTNASAWTLDALNLSHPEQSSVETFRQYNDTPTIVWFLLQAVLILPAIEELFFRGFLLTFLKNYTSTWPAIVLSAGVFAFAHLNLGAVLPLWFLGVVLGVAYEHTGCLLVPMVIHGCFNLATGLALLMEKANTS